MAVRAKKAKVLLPVVKPVPVDVIHVQYYRLAVPLGPDATRLAGVRHATRAGLGATRAAVAVVTLAGAQPGRAPR